jgi:serine phosphatase RsbU (regulator of sigma subunit)
MDRRLLKGTFVTLFFLAVILVQQLAGRRAKVRMIALRDALAAARTALRAALPTGPPAIEGLAGALAFEQAERIGGTTFAFHADPASPQAFDFFLAVPDGSGVDVAFASVFVRDLERRQRLAGDPSPEPLFERLAAAYREAPIQRPLELALWRIDLVRGELTGVCAGLEPPLVLAKDGALLEAERTPLDVEVDRALIEGPIVRVHLALPEGATLVVCSDGLPADARHPLAAADLAAEVRAHAARTPAELVAALRKQALRRAGNLQDDLFLLALARSA